jgi:outer membrane protein
LATETAKFNEALRDSLQNFLKDYNADKHFDLILSKAGDNILLGSNKLDITQDVINGLNKRYKPAPKNAAETKKTEDKK